MSLINELGHQRQVFHQQQGCNPRPRRTLQEFPATASLSLPQQNMDLCIVAGIRSQMAQGIHRPSRWQWPRHAASTRTGPAAGGGQALAFPKAKLTSLSGGNSLPSPAFGVFESSVITKDFWWLKLELKFPIPVANPATLLTDSLFQQFF